MDLIRELVGFVARLREPALELGVLVSQLLNRHLQLSQTRVLRFHGPSVERGDLGMNRALHVLFELVLKLLRGALALVVEPR